MWRPRPSQAYQGHRVLGTPAWLGQVNPPPWVSLVSSPLGCWQSPGPAPHIPRASSCSLKNSCRVSVYLMTSLTHCAELRRAGAQPIVSPPGRCVWQTCGVGVGVSQSGVLPSPRALNRASVAQCCHLVGHFDPWFCSCVWFQNWGGLLSC